MRVLTFTVQARPRPKSATGSRRGQAGRFTPAPTRAFMRAVTQTAMYAAATAKWRPATGPVALGFLALFPRPDRLDRKGEDGGRRRHAVKPDEDNISKGLKDALTQARVWTDDCLVDTAVVRKRYAARDEATCVHVVIVADTADGDDDVVAAWLVRELALTRVRVG